MAFQRNNSVSKERFAVLVKNAVIKVKTEEDPLVLNDFKRLLKKNVPFGLRTYVAAYLAKQITLGASFAPLFAADKGKKETVFSRFDKTEKQTREAGRFSRGKRFERNEENERSGTNGYTNTKSNSAGARVVIPADKAATVFVGIGRSRGVFPRDIISLIIQNASVERERIGDIRVLDNYSFVQVYTEDAQKVIDSLNGCEYRGRKLNVSFSRKKDDGEDGRTGAAYTQTASEQPVNSGQVSSGEQTENTEQPANTEQLESGDTHNMV